MEPLKPASTDEVGSLLMENELLRYEVKHLRARLAAAGTVPEPVKRKGKGKPKVEPVAEPSQAEADLVWLLNRLNSSPLGAVLRRADGFRTLLERYGVGR
jgi:hypothetical protein